MAKGGEGGLSGRVRLPLGGVAMGASEWGDGKGAHQHDAGEEGVVPVLPEGPEDHTEHLEHEERATRPAVLVGWNGREGVTGGPSLGRIMQPLSTIYNLL